MKEKLKKLVNTVTQTRQDLNLFFDSIDWIGGEFDDEVYLWFVDLLEYLENVKETLQNFEDNCPF